MDVTEMTFGTWESPAHGQKWGEQHRCLDLTRVGPPEQGGCDGEYRYFAGQSFPTNHTWDWTAPFTADYGESSEADGQLRCSLLR